MAEALAEATGIVWAAESVLKTGPSSGWVVAQPNPGGIAGWEPLIKTVERDPLSKFATPEKGDLVGLDVDLTLTMDLNKDSLDMAAESIFRCVGKHFGGKIGGTPLNQRLYRPTAVTATGYTVPANGDAIQNTLIYARGFINTGNNGLKVVGASSTSTEIKTSGLTVESSPPANVTVDIVGVQGASGDFQIDGNGNIINAALDFTTLGLQVGMWVKIGGVAASTFFSNQPTYNGRARITAIAAHLITLERRTWTPGSADNGAGKTIQLFFPSLYRNYTLDSANYKKATLHGEMENLGPGTGGAATYTYAQGLAVTQWDIDAPLESKITQAIKMVGLDIPNPVLVGSRISGPSTAYSPQAAALFDTASDLRQVRLTDTLGNLLPVEVNSWKFSLNNNVRGKKVQATLGNVSHIYGKFMFSVSMELYFTDFTTLIAMRDNRDMQWDAYQQNDQAALLLDLPNVATRGAKRTFAANQPVMLTCDVPAFRDEVDNIAGALCLFGFVP